MSWACEKGIVVGAADEEGNFTQKRIVKEKALGHMRKCT